MKGVKGYEGFSFGVRVEWATMDRINRNFSEYIRGVETYTNPFESTQIQLPSGYNDAWVNARGEYLLSNDSNFNPNIGDNADWRRMNSK